MPVVNNVVMPPGMTALRIVLWMFIKTVNVLYLPFYLTRRFRKSKRCPPIENQILLLPASELAERIRKQELTSENVINAYVSRVKAVNPVINAVIDDRFKDAIADAKKIDKFIASQTMTVEEIRKQKPLLGVPLSVKGSINVANMKNTAGSVSRADNVAKEDATTVRYAREAGAIPILTSNIPELCMNWESTNKIIGTTRNPHNTTRTSGGSSGGEASLLATAASIIGIGSDVAGSLRLPAHFCGVWGHKPTPGVVSFEGHYPSCKHKDIWRAAFTLGPMARYAGDLKLLLGVISEPDVRFTLNLEEPVDIKNLKIFYMESIDSYLTGKVTEDCLTALHDVLEHLNGICQAECTKINLPLMNYMPEMASLTLLDIDDVDNLFPGRGDGAVKELFKFVFRRSSSTISCIFYGIIRKLTYYVPKSTTEGCKKKMDELRSEFIRMLGDNGVLLFPAFTAKAHHHGEIYTKLFDNAYLSVFNTLGFPVTNCPVKFTKDSLPVGIQVVGAPHSDRLTLAVAEEIERAFGGWQPPPSDRSRL